MAQHEDNPVVSLAPSRKADELSSSSTIATAKERLRPATREQIASILAGLTAVYGRPEGWDFAIKLYVAALAELPLDVLDQAASTHLATSKYFPKPSELLELTRDQMSGRKWRLENASAGQPWTKRPRARTLNCWQPGYADCYDEPWFAELPGAEQIRFKEQDLARSDAWKAIENARNDETRDAAEKAFDAICRSQVADNFKRFAQRRKM